MVAILKQINLKATRPRQNILNVLQTAKDRHLRAEDVYRHLLQAGQDIALATVYRVLARFEKEKIVVRHYFEGGISVFELNDGMHHDHLVCVQCARVEEFTDRITEKRLQEVVRQAAYLMIDHSLNIYGICQGCQTKEN